MAATSATRDENGTPRAHVLTVSVEEYFHGQALAKVVLQKHWDRFESRLDHGVDAALRLLDRSGARATFFVLGVLAERHPAAVARIAAAGHEVASRGYWPRGAAELTADEFAADLDRAAAAIAAAGGGRVAGYRSPRRLRPQDAWMLAVLAQKGYAYDASVDPSGVRFLLRPEFHVVGVHELPGGARLVEAPVSTLGCGLARLPIGSGGAMRHLPEWLLRLCVAHWVRRRAAPLVFELKSWELDPGQPHVTAASRWSSVRQYRNLARARDCLAHYLARYPFVAVADHLGLLRPPLPAQPARPVALPARPVAAAAPLPAPPDERLPLVSVVVPMFREQDNVPCLLRTLGALGRHLADRYRFEFVFVDDASDDQTWEVLQRACAGRADVRLLRHEQNRGVAAAIMSGIGAAGADVVCSLDCDLSYDPMDLEQMLPALGDADVLTASPYHPDGQVLNVPRWRLLLSRGLSRLYRLLLRQPLCTWTSCFRVYRRRKVAGLPLEHGGFLGVAELLVRVLRRGGTVREYPTLLESRLLGVSKMRTLRAVCGHLGLLWAVWRGRIR